MVFSDMLANCPSNVCLSGGLVQAVGERGCCYLVF